MKEQFGECRQSTAVILEYLGVPTIEEAIALIGMAALLALGWEG